MRERKRHTARRVAALSPDWRGGGTPDQSLSGRMEYAPPRWTDEGTPPPPKVGQTHTCENITSRHPSDAGGKYVVYNSVNGVKIQ